MKDQDDEEPLQVDAEGGNKDYRALGIEIGDDLHDDDIEALKFISRDFLPGAKLERMKTTQDLFSSWEKYGKFGKNLSFLAECLAKIGRLDLLEELGYEEEEVENKIEQGRSEISEYRKMLFEIGEDLDSEELQKMLYLVGDLKKKDREKIKSVLGFFSYLEQKKTIDQLNLSKLEEMLKTIDRNDLVEIIVDYKVKAGLGRPEEGMDTSENNLPQMSRHDVNQKNVQGTVAERPAAHALPAGLISLPPHQDRIPSAGQVSLSHHQARIPPSGQPSAGLQREVPLRVACEDRREGLRAEREPSGSIASPFVPELQPVTQDVIVDDMLKDISDNIAREVSDSSWLVFGTQLKLEPDILQRLSRQWPQMNERVYNMLTCWLHSWRGGHDSAMSSIINALHEVQIHHLADSFSRIYRPQGLGETESQSLTSRTENISVRTNEAQYAPEAPVALVASAGNIGSEMETVREPIAVASPVVELVEDKVLPSYRMDRKPRGLCIIMNIEKFNRNPEDPRARDMPNREGSSVDAKNLMNTFKDLYFEVHLHENLSSTNMVRLMVQTALNVDHTNYDCFVCCILSHGTTGHVYGSDGCLVNISELTGPLKTVVCPSLAGKPKLFFIQACQGRQKQEGHEMEEDSGVRLDTDGLPREVIPNEADFLMGYATVPGFVSYRSRSHGSWYITKLCDMLNKYGKKYDLLSVLLLVNNEIGRANAMMEGGRYKQSPAPLYTLRKKLIFS